MKTKTYTQTNVTAQTETRKKHKRNQTHFMASECLGNRGLERTGEPNLREARKRPIYQESSEPTKPQGHVPRIYGGSGTLTCAVHSSVPPGRIFKFDNTYAIISDAY
jgi:hypothetical protein